MEVGILIVFRESCGLSCHGGESLWFAVTMAQKSLRFCPNVHVVWFLYGFLLLEVFCECVFCNYEWKIAICFENEQGRWKFEKPGREHANFISLPYGKVRTQAGPLAPSCKSAAGYGVKHWRAFKACELRAVELVLSGKLIRHVSPTKKKNSCTKNYFIRMS